MRIIYKIPGLDIAKKVNGIILCVADIMKLANEDVGFKISTTGAVAEYSDDGTLVIGLTAKTKNCTSNERFPINIHFKCVAELICKTINFYESNYEEFEIITPIERDRDRQEISGFYQVLDSPWFKASEKVYDSKMRLNLKHYLLTGGDGYFEILASGYSVVKLPPE